MVFLKALFIVVEVFCCLMLIGLVLLQKSKSEGLGLAFGAGAGESLFGARAGNVLSRATVVLGVVFLASSLVLGVVFSQKEKSPMDDLAEGAPIQQSAIIPDIPVEGLEVDIPAIGSVEPEAEVPASNTAEEI